MRPHLPRIPFDGIIFYTTEFFHAGPGKPLLTDF